MDEVDRIMDLEVDSVFKVKQLEILAVYVAVDSKTSYQEKSRLIDKIKQKLVELKREERYVRL